MESSVEEGMELRDSSSAPSAEKLRARNRRMTGMWVDED
jgi:hypothetical protein